MAKTEIAVFGGGCFWCTEAVFRRLKGVMSVMPGYAGGTTKNPTYEQVCTGTTGHAEVTRIEYDPEQVSYDTLLTIFFASHDPTSLDRQGGDVGPQYRSIILYTTPEQRGLGEKFIVNLNAASKEGKPVVTQLEPLGEFYSAEEYHREYYEKNKAAPYCQIVINPKLKKLKETYAALLKETE